MEKNDTSCTANLALKRTGIDKKDNIYPSVGKSIDLDLYMDDSAKTTVLSLLISVRIMI